LPPPSQKDSTSATPFLQEATWHETPGPGYVQARVVTPSQTPPQAVPAPAHPARPWGGCWFAGIGVHLPSVPASAHASHWPLQSLSQHTPSTQCELAHSASIEHFVPSPDCGLQTPPRQKSPDGQSAFVLHPVHCVCPQTPGLQSWVRFDGHDPEPLQNSASVATFVFASQAGPRHCRLCPGSVHAVVRTPLQAPSQPVPSPVQAGRAPTGLPVTGEQVPTLFGRLQASHCPTQSSLQHTPSAQKPLRHWFVALHTAPGLPFALQTPAAQ
jgi:hypothetical protein